MDVLNEKIQELLELGKEAIQVSDSHKMLEPQVTITWHNDGSISGELYSYCLDLYDGGRHHKFQVVNEKGLLVILDTFIKKAREEINERRFEDA